MEVAKIVLGHSDSFMLDTCVSLIYPGNRISKSLGWFNIWISGHRYGCHEPDSTLLGNSYDRVGAIIRNRGGHTSALSEYPANDIALRLGGACFGGLEFAEVQGMSSDELYADVIRRRLWWAPDGDEAFDDGSNVIIFDIGASVRLVGFRMTDNAEAVVDVHESAVPEAVFYDLLIEWRNRFEKAVFAL